MSYPRAPTYFFFPDYLFSITQVKKRLVQKCMDRLGLTVKVSNNKRSTSRPLALLRKRYSSKFNTSVKIQKFNELVRNKTNLKSNINTRMK